MKVNHFLLVAGLLHCATGCPKPIASPGGTNSLSDRDAIAKLLPSGWKMEDTIPVYPNFPATKGLTTLEKVLADVGAKVDSKGKLVDQSGKEIVFVHRITGGPTGYAPPPLRQYEVTSKSNLGDTSRPVADDPAKNMILIVHTTSS